MKVQMILATLFFTPAVFAHQYNCNLTDIVSGAPTLSAKSATGSLDDGPIEIVLEDKANVKVEWVQIAGVSFIQTVLEYKDHEATSLFSPQQKHLFSSMRLHKAQWQVQCWKADEPAAPTQR